MYQMFPSAPTVIPYGIGLAEGIVYSVKTPLVVTSPILFAPHSVNQMSPSGPAVIPTGLEPGVGTVYSFIPAVPSLHLVPFVLVQPILSVPYGRELKAPGREPRGLPPWGNEYPAAGLP